MGDDTEQMADAGQGPFSFSELKTKIVEYLNNQDVALGRELCTRVGCNCKGGFRNRKCGRCVCQKGELF